MERRMPLAEQRLSSNANRKFKGETTMTTKTDKNGTVNAALTTGCSSLTDGELTAVVGGTDVFTQTAVDVARAVNDVATIIVLGAVRLSLG
jgi:hypothetical protein